MKKGIHPEYNTVTLKCQTCHSDHTFGSTVDAKEVNIDVCSKCHAFYTGDRSKMKSTGRVDRFNKRFAKKK